MDKAEIFSFPTIPGSGGCRQSLHNKVLVGAKGLRKCFLSILRCSAKRLTLQNYVRRQKVLRRGYDKSPSKHPQKTPPTWLLPPTIATSHHCPLRFRHAEMTVTGTVMGIRNFSPGEIGHWQPQQQANIDTTRRQRVVPLHS
jgi:hypothetical protein